MFDRRSAPHPGNRDAGDGRQVAIENTPGRLIEPLEARLLLHAGDRDARDGVTDFVLDGGAGTDTAKKDTSDPTTSIEVLYTGA